jgi:hypothetical protein
MNAPKTKKLRRMSLQAWRRDVTAAPNSQIKKVLAFGSSSGKRVKPPITLPRVKWMEDTE